MVSKNNVKERQKKSGDQKPHYAVKKLTIGVVSVLVGTSFAVYNNSASADTTSDATSSTTLTDAAAGTTSQAADSTTSAAANSDDVSTQTAAAETQSSDAVSAAVASTNGNQATAVDQTTVAAAPAADTSTTVESEVSRELSISVSYTGAANNPITETRKLTFNGTQTQTTSNNITTTTYRWQENQASVQTTTPVIDGYIADASAVDQEISLDEQGNLIVTVNGTATTLTDQNPTFSTLVTYKKIGKVVPVDENGNVIQTDGNGAYVDSPSYQNDATDATKASYTTPTIAGYLTMQASDEGTHSPSDPTADTKIYYVPAQIVKNVTRTITYTGAGNKTPASETYTATFTQTNTRDEQTGGLTRTWDKTTATWPAVTIPSITGYTPNITEIAENNGVTIETADQTVTVTYTPDVQKATVSLIDNDDNGTVVKTVDLTGVSDGQIDFKDAADALTTLKKAGYELADSNDQVQSDGTFNTAVFDTDDATDQTFSVYLVHRHDTTQNTKTITRTINYTGAKTNPDSVSQTAAFTETIVTDAKTGTVLSDDWQTNSNNWTAVDTPTIAGYTADVKTVAADENITHDTNDQIITVAYAPNEQKAVIKFFDGDQVVYSQNLAGKTDQTIDLTAAQSILTNFENAGYTVVDGDLSTAYTYDDDDDQDQTIAVKLQHPTTTKTVKLTVAYTGAGDATPTTVNRDVVFDGVITYDPTTNTTKTVWTPQSQSKAEVTTPIVAGYIADQTSVAAAADQTTQTVTVNYAKIGSIKAVDQNGTVLTTISYQNDQTDAAKAAQTVLPTVTGYVPQNDQQSVAPTNATQDTTVIYLPIAAQFTQAVTFSGAGDKTPATQSQTIALTTEKTSGTFSFVVPKLAGYQVTIAGAAATVDQGENILVTGDTVTADSTVPAAITVVYTPQDQTGSVAFVDDDDSANQLTTIDLSGGKTDKEIDFTDAAAQLTSYLKAGYQLGENTCIDDNGSFKTAVYGQSNVFTVHLKHQKATVDSTAAAQKLTLPTGVTLSTTDQQALLNNANYQDSATGRRTIKYAFTSSDSTTQTPTADDQDQLVTFGRSNTYTVDLVTGSVTKNLGDWHVETTPASDGSATVDAVTPLTFAGWYLAVSTAVDSLDAVATADGILKAHQLQPSQVQTLTLTYKKLANAAISIWDEKTDANNPDKATLLNTYTAKGQQGAAIDCDQLTEIVKVTTKDASGNETTVTTESAADANAQLNAYLKAGYQLDQTQATVTTSDNQTAYTFKNGAVVVEKDGVYSFANTYDADDATAQDYAVYLIHGTTTATKNKTITRTINLHKVDQTTETTTQSCTLTETIITDNVTGETISDTWDTGEWDAYTIPSVDGYVASENSLEKTTVYNTTSDSVVNVIYVPNSATATIKIIDDDANSTELNEYLVSGTTAGEVNFNQAITQLKKYLTGKYTFNTSNKNNSAKITIAYNNGKLDSLTASDIYGAASQTYEVHLIHQKSTSKEFADMTRTINLELPSGTQIVTQTVQISRTATTDLVNGSHSYGDWTTASWPALTVPVVPGYQASASSIAAETVVNTTPDKSINVVYTPITQHVNVSIVDDDKNTTLAQADLTGSYGQTVDFDKPALSLGNVSPNGKLQEFLKNGFVLAADDNVASDGQHFAAATYGLKAQTIVVHLKEGTTTTQETQTLTRTINYILEGKTFKTLPQSVELTRNKIVNLVTGKTTYTDWTTGQWDEAISPTHETDPTDIPVGYTPDKDKVAQQTVLHASGNQIVLVYYSRPSDYQGATIKIIDEDDGNVVLWTQETAGKSGTAVDFTSANQALQNYLDQGFAADSTSTLANQSIGTDLKTFADQNYDSDANSAQTFTVYLKHGTKQLDAQSREITRTINYTFPDGTTRTYIQAVDFTRTVTRDLVAERNIYGSWTFSSAKTTLSSTVGSQTTTNELSGVTQAAVWGEIDTAQAATDANEDLTGYTASQDVIAETTGITEQTPSQVINITFSPKVETVKIGVVDTTVAADTKNGTPEFDFLSVYTGTTNGYFGKSINVDLVNQYLNQFLNQNGYLIGVDTQTGTATLSSNTTTDNADGSQTQTLVYTYTAGNTTNGTITETITTDQSSTDANGNTITVKHYHFASGDAESSVTATTTTTSAGKSSTVYQLVAGTLTDTQRTMIVPLLHYRTTAVYSTTNPPADTYKDIVRTIIYHLPDGTTETRTQTVRFTRSITTDHVTGTRTASSWSTGTNNYSWIETQIADQSSTKSEVTRTSTWSSQATPDETDAAVGSIVKGYTPSQTTVAEKAVTSTTPDSVVEITYKADKQSANIQIIDQTTGTVLSNYNVHGVTKETVNFKDANSQLSYYLKHGYLLADSNNDDVATSDDQTSFKAANYDNEDDIDQTFKAYLIHDTAKTDQAVDSNLTTITDVNGKTVDYVDNVKTNPKVTNPASYVQTVVSKRTTKFVFDGDSTTKPTVADCVQTVKWTRTVKYTIDLVTGKETPEYGTWTFVESSPDGKSVTSATNGGAIQTTTTTVDDTEKASGYVAAVNGSFAGWYLVSADSATGKQTLPALDSGQGLNQTVVLEYKEYAKATIQIIDDNATGSQGTLYDETKEDGLYKQGEAIDFAAANAQLTELLSQGYVFDHANTNGHGTTSATANGFTADTYDAKDNEDQSFIVYLHHDTAQVTSQLTENSSLTAASGRSAYLKNALTNDTLTKAASYQEGATSMRTVTFKFISNTTLPTGVKDVNDQTVTQIVTYTRPIGYTVDLVTGTATRDYQTWQVDAAVNGTTSQGTTTTIDQNGQVTQSTAATFTGDTFPAVAGNVAGWYLDSGDASAVASQLPLSDQAGSEDSDLTKAAANVASAVTLTFKKLQNAYVKIIDEDDSNSVLYDETAADANSANQAQKQGTSISFTQAQTKLDALLKAGYVLDSAKTQPLNQTTFKAAVFDSDDTGDQIITVYLKHGTATIGVDTTKQTSQAEAGTVINADSDNQVTWPDAVKYDNLTRQATQTVNYRYQGEAQAHESNVQNAVLTRTVTIDKVTGKVIGYSTFTTHKFSSVASPTIDNYEYVKSADKVVAGETATAVVGQDGQETDQLTFEYTVYYKTNGTWKKINEPVYDESGKVSYQSDATGAHYITKSDDASTVTATVPTYQGYTAVFETNGDQTTDQTLNKNSQTSAQNQVISLQNDQAGQDSTVTYTPDAQKLTYRIYDQTLGQYINVDAADQLTEKTYGTLADGFSDGDAFYTTTTKQQTTNEKLQALQNSLVKLGYLIVKTDNLPTTFDHDDDINQNVTITVAHDYAIFKNSQTAQDAKMNGTVTDQTGQSAVYLWGDSDNGNQLVTDAAYADNTTATRTINFVFNGTAKSKPSPASIVQTVTYQRSIVWTMDLVTGAMTRDHADWQFVSAKTGATQTTMTEDGTITTVGESDSLGKEVMPAVTGSFAGWYQTSGTAAELASDAQLLSPDAQKEGVAANQTATVNLTYLRYQKATIQIIDDNADDKQTLTNDQLTAGDGTLYTQIELEGQQGQAVDFTAANALLQKLLAAGYQFEASGNDNLDGTQFKASSYDSDDFVDQTFIIKLIHQSVTIDGQSDSLPTAGQLITSDTLSKAVWPDDVNATNLTRQAARTIEYEYADSTSAVSDQVKDVSDSAVLTRTVTIDKVTGKVLGTGTFTTHEFAATANPVITGYHTDAKTTAGFTASADNLSSDTKVIYYANGKYFNQKDGSQTAYTTDPNDASQVTGTITIAPGYTAHIQQKQGTIDQANSGTKSITYTFTPDDPSADTTVDYTANPQKAIVKIIDDGDSGKLLNGTTGETLTGTSDGDIDFSKINEELQDLLKHGYLLNQAGANSDNVDTQTTSFKKMQYDHDDGAVQEFIIHLVHDQATIDQKPTLDQNITDASGNLVNYHPQTDLMADKAFAENRTSTRTVTYQFKSSDLADSAKPSVNKVVQTVNYSRSLSYTIDLATGKIIAAMPGNWQFVSGYTSNNAAVSTDGQTISYQGEGNLSSAVLPQVSGDFAGWYLDQSDNVESKELLPGDDQIGGSGLNETGTLTYLHYQNATIKLIDSQTNQILYNESVTQQKQGATVDFSKANAELKTLLETYELDQSKQSDGTTNGFNAAVYDQVDTSDQEFVIYLIHQTTTITREKDVTETISYVYEDQSKAAEPFIKTIKATQTGIEDLVTKEINWNGAISFEKNQSQFDAVTAPTNVKGYHPDQAQINAIDLSSLTWEELQNVDKTVAYLPNTQTATIKIYDDDNDASTPLWTKDLTGTTVAAIDFTIGNSQLSYYLSHGYQLAETGNDDLVGNQFKAASYDNEDDQTQVFVAHLTHAIKVIGVNDQYQAGTKIYADTDIEWPALDLTKDASQTIHYAGAGQQTPANHIDTAAKAFSRTATIDLVTGKIEKYSDFTGSKTFAKDVKTPVVAGYHVKESDVLAGGLTATGEAPDQSMTIEYLPNGSLILEDQSHTLAADQLQSIQYTTDSNHPDKVTVTVPLYQGYTAKIGDQVITKDNQQLIMTAATGAGGNLTVIYTADAQTATVKIYDDDNDASTPLWTKNLTGTTAAAIDFTIGNSQLSYYLSHGYQLAETGNDDLAGNQFKAASYDNEDDQTQIFAAHLIHATKLIGVNDQYQAGTKIYADTDIEWPALDLTKNASQTIHYIGAGQLTPADHVDTATKAFSRTATIDLVTGKIEKYSDFTGSKTFAKDVKTPVVAGYHVKESDVLAGGLTATGEAPDQSMTIEYLPNGSLIAQDASGQTMKDFVPVQYTTDQDNASHVQNITIPTFAGYTATIKGIVISQGIDYQVENAGQDTIVVYTADPQKLTVRFIDRTNNSQVDQTELNGQTDQSVDFTQANTLLQKLLAKYVLASDNPALDQNSFKNTVYGTNDDQIIEVYLEHGHQDVTETKAVTEKITYVINGTDRQTAPDPVVVTKQTTRKGSQDLVDGSIVWSDQIETVVFDPVVSPTVAGYLPDIVQTAAITVPVTNDNWLDDLTQNITVTYEPVDQTADVAFVDLDDTNQALTTVVISGKSDQLIDFSTADAKLQEFLAAGYEFAGDTGLKDAWFDHDDADQHFTIYLKHGKQADQRTKPVTETIDYVYENQTKAADSVVKTIVANQTGVYDRVTQTTDWNGAITFDADFEAVTSPTINGYTADSMVIDAGHPQSSDWDDLDVIKTVVYHANQQKLTFTIHDQTADTDLKLPENALVELGINGNVLATGLSEEALSSVTKSLYERLIKAVSDYFVPLGYTEPVSQTLPDSFDADDNTDQNVVITLTHDQDVVSQVIDASNPKGDNGKSLPSTFDQRLSQAKSFWDDQTSTRTVSYDFQTNDDQDVPNVAQAVQTVVYRRSVAYHVDRVTGQIVGELIYGQPSYYSSSTTAVFAKQDDGSDQVKTSGANDSLGTNEIPGVTGEFAGWYEELADNNGTEEVFFDGQNWYAIDESGQKQIVAADQLGKIVFKRYQKARTEIIDDDENGQVIFDESQVGKQNAAVDFQSAAAKLDELLADGYELADQSTTTVTPSRFRRFGIRLFANLRAKTASAGQNAFGSAAYDTDDNNVQVFTVHVKHQKETQQESKTITRTISYHQPDGTTTTIAQPATITRTVSYDKVTKQATPTTAWSEAEQPAQTTPVIDGYTPDKASVDSATVDDNTADSSVDVVYYRTDQQALISLIDDELGQTLQTIAVNGHLNEMIDFSMANQALNDYLAHGYQLAKSGNDDLNAAQTAFKDAKYHAIDGTQQFTAHLIHVLHDTTEDRTITRTIILHLPDESTKTFTQPATISRTVQIDEATGKKTFGDWSAAQWDEMQVPTWPGYTPSQSIIAVERVDGQTIDQTIDIHYLGHVQNAIVSIIDQSTGKILTKEALSGRSDQPINFTQANQQLKEYLSTGYVLTSDNPAVADQELIVADFDHDDQINQTFTIHLEHRIDQVPETKTVTRFIKYWQPDGTIKTVQETQSTTRTQKVDAVTGQVVSICEWSQISWPAVIPPTISGYQSTVGQSVDLGNDTILVEVHYQADQHDQDDNHSQSSNTNDHDQDKLHADRQSQSNTDNLNQSNAKLSNGNGIVANVSAQGPREAKPNEHSNTKQLPQTGDSASHQATLWGSLVIGLSGLLSGLGFNRKRKD